MAPAKHQLGHRARLRERFLNGRLEAVAEYELLEILLFAAYPRGDVKPLAKSLIKSFKNLAGVLSADTQELLQIQGMGPAAVASLKAVQDAAQLLLRSKAEIGPVQSSMAQVIDYCKTAMARLKDEQLRLLFLDTKNQLIADEVQQEGTVNHTPVYTRKVIKRALDLGASGLILVHNHPSGDPTPSSADVKVTRDIQSAATKLGIDVHDHIIIAKDNFVSFRAKGLL